MTLIEKKALIVVMGILLISFLVQWLRPHVENSEIYDYSLEDSLFKALSGDTIPVTTDSGSLGSLDSKTSKKSADINSLKININTATQKDLEKLPRIGPSTAKKIIDYRNKHGSFTSLRDLIKVKRIGSKTLELIKPHIFIVADTSHQQ